MAAGASGQTGATAVRGGADTTAPGNSHSSHAAKKQESNSEIGSATGGLEDTSSKSPFYNKPVPFLALFPGKGSQDTLTSDTNPVNFEGTSCKVKQHPCKPSPFSKRQKNHFVK